MSISVCKHAVRRYKERVTGRKTTSGQKCTEQIKSAIRTAYRITKLDFTDKRYNYGAYYYYTEKFIAVVQRQGYNIFVITIKEYHQKKEGTA